MKRIFAALFSLVCIAGAVVFCWWMLEELAQSRAALAAGLDGLKTSAAAVQTRLDALAAEKAKLEAGLDVLAAQEAALQTSVEQSGEQIRRFEGMLYLFDAEGNRLEDGFMQFRAGYNAAEQELYDLLRVSVLQNRMEVSVARFGMDLKQVSRIFFRMLDDDPALFWMDNVVTGWYEGDRSVVDRVELARFYEEEEKTPRLEGFYTGAAEVVEAAARLDTDLEKIRYVHDHLVDTVSYNLGKVGYGADSAVLDGEAVCSGYAMAFSHYMHQLGIPVAYCTGRAGGVHHAWNLVMVDGAYYNVDVTWDDPVGAGGERSYEYFLRSDDFFKPNHSRDEESQKLPACTSARFDDRSWEEGGQEKTVRPPAAPAA